MAPPRPTNHLLTGRGGRRVKTRNLASVDAMNDLEMVARFGTSLGSGPRNGIGSFFRKVGKGIKKGYKKTARGVNKAFQAFDKVIPPEMIDAIAKETGNPILMGTAKAFRGAEDIARIADKHKRHKAPKLVQKGRKLVKKGQAAKKMLKDLEKMQMLQSQGPPSKQLQGPPRSGLKNKRSRMYR